MLLGQLDLDAELPADAQSTGYHTEQAELWFGPDRGDQYAYLDTDRGIERWPRAREPIGCGVATAQRACAALCRRALG